MASEEGCCLFCLRTFQRSHHSNGNKDKSIAGISETNNERERKLLQHFFILLRRHLLEEDINLKAKNPALSFEKKDCQLQSALEPCLDCATVIKSFCDIYNEIKTLELKLNWRLGTLLNIVRCSKKVKHRMTAFQQKMEQQLKDSTDDHFDIHQLIKEIGEFRNEIVKKCTVKLKSVYPKVKLMQIDSANEARQAFKGDTGLLQTSSNQSTLTDPSSSIKRSLESLPKQTAEATNNVTNEPYNFSTFQSGNDTSSLSSSLKFDTTGKLLLGVVGPVGMEEIIEAVNEVGATQSDLAEVASTELEANKENDSDLDQSTCHNSKRKSPESSAKILFNLERDLQLEGNCSAPTLELVRTISTKKINQETSDISEVSEIEVATLDCDSGEAGLASGSANLNVNLTQKMDHVLQDDLCQGDSDLVDTKQRQIAAYKTLPIENGGHGLESSSSMLSPEEVVVVLNNEVNEPLMDDASNSSEDKSTSFSHGEPEAVEVKASSQLVIIDGTVASENIWKVGKEVDSIQIIEEGEAKNSEYEVNFGNGVNQTSGVDMKPDSSTECKLTNKRFREVEVAEKLERISHEHCSSPNSEFDSTSTTKIMKTEEVGGNESIDIGLRIEDCYSIQNTGNITSEENNLETIMDEIIESVVDTVDTFQDYELNESTTVPDESDLTEGHEVKLAKYIPENEYMLSEISIQEKTISSKVVEDIPALSTRRKSSRTTHKCSTCSRSFATAITLKAHQKICASASDQESEVENESDHNNFNDDAWEPDMESLNISETEDFEADKTNVKTIRVLHFKKTDVESKADVKPKKNLDEIKFNLFSTTYSCEFKTLDFKCPVKFYNPEDLENHSKLHGKFKCSFCPEVKSYAPAVPMHELTHRKFHSSQGPNAEVDSKKWLLCPHCSFRSIYEPEYMRHHLKRHMNLIPDSFTCPLCKYKFVCESNIRDKLLKHYKTQHQTSSNSLGRIHRCKYGGCGAYFMRNYHLKIHTLQQHTKVSSFMCVDCDLHYAINIQLKLHLERNHAGKARAVGGCGRKFITKKSSLSHKKVCLKSGSLSGRYKCSICSKSFPTWFQLRVHRKSCATTIQKQEPLDDDDDDVIKIPKASKKWRKAVSDINFMKTKYPCLYSKCSFKCKAIFYNPEDLENHSKLHGKFKCSFCPVQKSYAPNIPIHELTHKKFHSSHGSNAEVEAKKSFLCSHCNFKTKFKGMYVKHFLKLHMGLVSNQYTCPICKFKWIQRADTRRKCLRHYVSHHQIESKDPAEIYRCEYDGCSAYFLKRHQLALHNLDHFPERSRYRCVNCDKRFPHHDSMKRHFEVFHSDDKSNPLIPCTMSGCGRKFLTEENMKRHRKVCLKKKVKKEYKEPVNIKKAVDNINDLRRLEYKGPFPYPCREMKCSEKYFTPEELKKHSKFHGNFKCKFCEEVKTYAPDLSIHELEQHTNKTGKSAWYTCAQCKLHITGRDAYVNHHLEHLHLPPLTETSCIICKHTFTVCKDLKKNIQYHYENAHYLDGKEPFRCEEEGCSAYFRRTLQLNQHMARMHCKREMVENEKPIKCPDCDWRFRLPFDLRLHRSKVHRSKFTFKCNEKGCNRAFETAIALQNHQNLHKQKLIEMCKVCGKSCKSQVALGLHMVIHTEAGVQRKPRRNQAPASFMCAECGKYNKNRHLHETHMLSHSGPESWPYTCETCGKKCLTMQKLDEHQNTHRKKDKIVFTCEHCGLTYAHRHNFRHHLKNKHGVILPDTRKIKNKKVRMEITG